MRQALQEQRLDAVSRIVLASGARSVLDLGCGQAELLARLVEDPRFERLVGIDVDQGALHRARLLLGLDPLGLGAGRVRIQRGSFTNPELMLTGFDLAALVETIEHVDPKHLSAVERTVFGCWRPGSVIVTTPNVEYNAVYGMPAGELRHPDHRFEWTRARFREWAAGVGARNGYAVTHTGVGEAHRLRGQPTQIATFTRAR